MTVVSVKCGWAWRVLLPVGLVFRELLYYLGRWARGSAGGQSPTCECYRLIISESTRLSVRTPVINVSDKLFLLTVWFYCGWHYLYVGTVPAASDSSEVRVGAEPWGLNAESCPCGLAFLVCMLTNPNPRPPPPPPHSRDLVLIPPPCTLHTRYRCMYNWLISFRCTTWRWSTFVAETCSCALHIVNSIVVCGNKMPTRCNRGFYCRSYCLLNMFRASLCLSSGAQEYYTVVAACGILCCKNVKIIL